MDNLIITAGFVTRSISFTNFNSLLLIITVIISQLMAKLMSGSNNISIEHLSTFSTSTQNQFKCKSEDCEIISLSLFSRPTIQGNALTCGVGVRIHLKKFVLHIA